MATTTSSGTLVRTGRIRLGVKASYMYRPQTSGAEANNMEVNEGKLDDWANGAKLQIGCWKTGVQKSTTVNKPRV